MSDKSVSQSEHPLTPEEVAIYYSFRAPKIERNGLQWRGPCPVHDGDDDNFAVNADDGRWYCHSQCGRGGNIFTLEQELSAVDLPAARSVVFRIIGRPSVLNIPAHPIFREPVPDHTWRFLHDRIEEFAKVRNVSHVENYYYTHADGSLCFVKARFTDGRGKKEFQKYALTRKGGWTTPKRLKIASPLYNLHRLTEAKEIHLCNGEKAANAGLKLGLTTTCTPDGEGRWDETFTSILTGKLVHVYPDNDATGTKHAEVIVRALVGRAAEVRIVPLPDLPPKGDLFDWIEAGGTEPQLRAILRATALAIAPPNGPDAPTATAIVGPPGGFRLTDESLVYEELDSDNGPVVICGRLEVAAKTRSKDSEDWGRLLRWHDDDGVAHTWAMPLSLLQGDGSECRERLVSGGLFIAPGARARNLLNIYLQTAPADARARCVSRIGWYGDCFVLPDVAIGAAGEVVLFQTEQQTHHALYQAGTLDDWRTHVGEPCSGNSRLVLSISCGFAGPILAFAGAESGGIHFQGPSSIGKSTALIVGGSVCGGGQPGFVNQWRTTINGLETIAELHNDLTLFLDELAQVDSKEAAETAYLLGNGLGKSRMTRSTGLKRKLSWRLLYVSSGEITLADHALSAGKRTKGGAEVRLLNVSADPGAGLGLFEDIHGAESPAAFSQTLKEAAEQYYGTPLRAFLEFIASKRLNVREAVHRFRTDFLRRNVEAGGSGEVHRAASRFASIAAAGELATEAGLTGWPEGEAIAAATRCFRSWLESRGTTGVSDVELGIRQVRAFIEANGSSRFQPCKQRFGNDGSLIPEKVLNRVGFRRELEDGESEYEILPEAFRREVCVGFDSKLVLRALRERGHLVTEDDNHLTVRRNLPEFGKKRVHVIKSSICSGDE